jgi:hypothetical protein
MPKLLPLACARLLGAKKDSNGRLLAEAGCLLSVYPAIRPFIRVLESCIALWYSWLGWMLTSFED